MIALYATYQCPFSSNSGLSPDLLANISIRVKTTYNDYTIMISISDSPISAHLSDDNSDFVRINLNRVQTEFQDC